MATLKNGFLSGKLGELVAYTRNGRNHLRKRPQRTAPPTQKELLNRHLFRLVQQWVTPLSQFLRQGFRDYSETIWGANAAKSLIFQQALQRQGTDSYVEPSLVKVSVGNLALPETLQAQLNPEGELEFSWSTETAPDSSPRDRIMMLAYNIPEKCAAYELCGGKRLAGMDILPLAGYPAGTYHVYAAFVTEDRERRSNSRFLGVVEV